MCAIIFALIISSLIAKHKKCANKHTINVFNWNYANKHAYIGFKLMVINSKLKPRDDVVYAFIYATVYGD